jgi:VWFA-related protein
VNKRIQAIVLVLFVLAVPFAPTYLAYAQETWDISINLVSPLEQKDGMLMKVYFTITDGGAPVMNAQPVGGQIALLNNNYVANAIIKKPDIPIYVALVLDASGTMVGTADKPLQEAAKLSLNNIPDDSKFAVIQFNESITLLQDFTDNVSAVSFAIDQYKAGRNKGTCIYDATYSTIESMSKLPAARRAVILFTDGKKDETITGAACSKHTYQELVDLGMKLQVPINTIGLSSSTEGVNAVELQAMAASTGGFSIVSSTEDLPATFGRIMDALKAQWMAEAVIYPKQGTNNAVLTVQLTDEQTLNQAFNFESGTDYPGPPSPVSVRLDGLVLDAAQQAYVVQLALTSPELAKYVKIEVWDKQGGSKAGEYIFNDPETFNSFLVPTEALTINNNYEMRISAINREDGSAFALSRDRDGNPITQLNHEFKFDPSSAYPNLQVQSVVDQSGDLVLNVSVTNPQLVGGFDGWLVDQDTNTQVANSNFTHPALEGTSGAITVPMKANRIGSGQYNVVLRVLAKNNNVFSTTVYEGVTYKAPSIFSRLGVALIAAPIFLVGIVVIILGVVAFLMFYSNRQKSMTGTPVLQGRLGAGMGKAGKAGGSSLPVSDNEPIPQRRGGTAAPPPPPPSVPVATPAASRVIEPLPSSQIPTNATLIGEGPASSGSGNETMMAAAPVVARAYLTVIRTPAGTASPGRISVDQFPFVIGRSEGHFNIQDPNISRRHAQITYDDVRRVLSPTSRAATARGSMNSACPQGSRSNSPPAP